MAPPTLPGVPSVAALVPRSLGELLSDTAALMRRHLREIVLLSLPFCAVELMLREGASTLVAAARSHLGDDLSSAADLSVIAVPFAGAVSLFFLGRLALQLLVGCLTAHASGALVGPPLTGAAALRVGLRAAPRLIITELLFDVMVGLAALTPAVVLIGGALLTLNTGLLIAAAIVSVLWGGFISIVLTLRWVLFPQLVVLEGLGPIAALRRSTQLMGPSGVRFLQGPKVRLSVLLLVSWTVVSSLQSMFLVPLIVIGVMQGLSLDQLPPPMAHISMWMAVPMAATQVLANAALLPVVGVLPTFFYFDLRVRHEGYGDDDDDEDDEDEDEDEGERSGDAGGAPT